MRRAIKLIGVALASVLYLSYSTMTLLVDKGGARGRRILFLVIGVRAVLGFGLVLLPAFPHEEPWAISFAISLWMIMWVLSPLFLTRAYVAGWMASRADSVHRLGEAKSFPDWLSGMVTHDAVHVLDMPPRVPDSPEGLED